MRTSLVRFAALLAVAGCTRSPERPAPVEPSPPAAAVPASPEPAAQASPPKGRLLWSTQSMDGRVEVKAWEISPGHCLVEATGPAPWSATTCLGASTWLFFVSPDGESLLGIDPFPLGEDERWATATIVTLFARGEAKKSTNAAAMVADELALKRFNKRFAWVAGSGGVAGPKPDYATATEVAITSADGHTFRIGFDGSGLPPPGQPRRRRAEAPAQVVTPTGGSPRVIGAAVPADEVPANDAQPVKKAPDVISYCTYPERKGSRNFFMCIRAAPSVATGICSSDMSAQYESRVVCSCAEDRSGECASLLR